MHTIQNYTNNLPILTAKKSARYTSFRQTMFDARLLRTIVYVGLMIVDQGSLKGRYHNSFVYRFIGRPSDDPESFDNIFRNLFIEKQLGNYVIHEKSSLYVLSLSGMYKGIKLLGTKVHGLTHFVDGVAKVLSGEISKTNFFSNHLQPEIKDIVENHYLDLYWTPNFQTELDSGNFHYQKDTCRDWHPVMNAPSWIRDLIFASNGYNHVFDITCSSLQLTALKVGWMEDTCDHPDSAIIRHTVRNSSIIREKLAENLGIPISLAKGIMTALVGGATIKLSDNGKPNSISELLNHDQEKIKKLHHEMKDFVRAISVMYNLAYEPRQKELAIRKQYPKDKSKWSKLPRLSARTRNSLIYCPAEREVQRKVEQIAKENEIKFFCVYDEWISTAPIDIPLIGKSKVVTLDSMTRAKMELIISKKRELVDSLRMKRIQARINDYRMEVSSLLTARNELISVHSFCSATYDNLSKRIKKLNKMIRILNETNIDPECSFDDVPSLANLSSRLENNNTKGPGNHVPHMITTLRKKAIGVYLSITKTITRAFAKKPPLLIQ